MEGKMNRFIALAKDNMGCPRAWGVSDTEQDAYALAKIELEEYRAHRRSRDLEPFTIEVKTLEEYESR
jgi:hypothetical protein